MEQQISRIDPLQAGKLAAAMYFVVGLVATPIALIGNFLSSDGQGEVPYALLIVLPLVYAILAFIFIPIFCWVYNQIANRLGGLKISLTNVPGSP
jgi:hypothetical protein